MNYGIILAGGKGSRMHTSQSKCLLPILGKPMLYYSIELFQQSFFQKTYCVLNQQMECLDLPSTVEIVRQKEPLGTADAVKTALEKIPFTEGFVFIVPGDAPFLCKETIKDMINWHVNEKNKITLATIRLDSPCGYGRVIREGSKVVQIKEEKDATLEEKKIQEVYCGFMCISYPTLQKGIHQIQNNNAQKEYYLTDIVRLVSLNEKVGTYEIKDQFQGQGINDLIQLSNAEKEYQKRILIKHMHNGIRMEHPESITIGPDVVFKGDSFIRFGTILLGKTTIYPQTMLGPYTEIIDSVIYENTNVSYSVITNSTIGKHSSIGPFAHIRNHTVIGKNNRIGNFVEVKQTTTGDKTYASHLTYLGNTQCGNGVNFGCGVITANYDGKAKHTTKIGNNVFIGCNSTVIAPIEIESNSYIAAGSTIVSNIGNGDFAIARSKQTTKTDYAKKYEYRRTEDK